MLALSGLGGCWKDAESIDRAVWSDDDTGQAYVKLLFEEGAKSNPLSTGNRRRNFHHQVFVQNPDGTDRQPVVIFPEFPGGDPYGCR